MATSELIDSQQDDGGWTQASDIKSDAYATPTVIVALLRAGSVSANHAAVRRGVPYLLCSQLDNGSWHVTTRAKLFQTYFESGFLHGKESVHFDHSQQLVHSGVSADTSRIAVVRRKDRRLGDIGSFGANQNRTPNLHHMATFRNKSYAVCEIVLQQLEHVTYHAGQAAFLWTGGAGRRLEHRRLALNQMQNGKRLWLQRRLVRDGIRLFEFVQSAWISCRALQATGQLRMTVGDRHGRRVAFRSSHRAQSDDEPVTNDHAPHGVDLGSRFCGRGTHGGPKGRWCRSGSDR